MSIIRTRLIENLGTLTNHCSLGVVASAQAGSAFDELRRKFLIAGPDEILNGDRQLQDCVMLWWAEEAGIDDSAQEVARGSG